MNFSTRLAKTTLAGAISIAASWACAAPVDVSFAASGSEGDWTLDFTVANNIVTPADMSVFFFAVQLGSSSLVDSPFFFTPLIGPLSFIPPDGGPETIYDFAWMDLDVASGGTTHLGPFDSLGGFILHSDSINAPTSL